MRAVEFDTGDGVRVSGLYVAVDDPRAVLIAIPGGGLHSGYFDGQCAPEVSFLDLAASLGYSALAVDRPGYGASTGIPDAMTRRQAQADRVWTAVEAVISDGHAGVPVGILGHSFGSMVGMTMAGRADPPVDLLGLSISGVGTTYQKIVLDEQAFSRMRNWGPAEYYPEGTLDRGTRPTAPSAGVENDDAIRWPDDVAGVAAAITCPVQVAFAEHELNWSDDLDSMAKIFVVAERVETLLQRNAGHNISLGWAARPYHLRVLAFFEDCLNARRTRGAADEH